MTKINKTKKMSIAFFSAFISALMVSTMVFAANAGERNGKGRGVKGGERGFPMLAQLNLTEAQQKKVDALVKTENDEIEKNRTEIDKLRAQMRALWEKDPVDKNKVKSLHKKMQSLHAKIADAHLSFRLGVYDVLTPEQRQKATAERKARHDRRAARRGGQGGQGNDGYWNERPRRDGRGCGNGKGRGQGRGDGRGPGFGPGEGMGPMW
ncbi:MAG: Spy/CpxP family protein refolding chaperone [Deltaproteobacteria bacterium]|nr:Spy/CpxP family protein refolding chaperone [Deltaproteobacteria bacterium]